MHITMKWLLLLTTATVILAQGCQIQPTSTPAVYSLPQLKYRLISYFGVDDVFWCDPDFYPIGQPGQEEENAIKLFPTIRADEAEFTAILKYLSLSNKTEYTNEEKLLIYRQHKKLTYAVTVTASEDVYSFTLHVGEGQGYRYEGIITPSGTIRNLEREVSFNTCPICLVIGTLIDTPGGPVPVEQLGKGMVVWTVDDMGRRTTARVLETAATQVPASFQVVRVRLNDGRTVTASAGHPTAEGQALGDYQAGDTLDGALVVAVEHLAYDGGATYDILPSGTTGVYWANGVLLKSTIPSD